MESDEFKPYDIEPTEKPNPPIKPDPRLINYLERMPNGVGGYRSWRHPIHHWTTIKNEPPHQYQVCEVCGRRRIYPPTQHVGDMICYPDFGWLETGKWTKPSKAVDPFFDETAKIYRGGRGVGESKFLQSAIEDVADKATAHFMQQVDELLVNMRSEVLPDQPSSKLKEAVISILSAWKNGYLFDPRFTMRMVAEKKLEMLESALRSEE